MRDSDSKKKTIMIVPEIKRTKFKQKSTIILKAKKNRATRSAEKSEKDDSNGLNMLDEY